MDPFEKAVRKWGINAQMDMVVEECAELIDAIQKLKRGRKTHMDVVAECVDVEIMLKQSEHIFGCGFAWKTIRKEKMERFQKHLEES